MHGEVQNVCVDGRKYAGMSVLLWSEDRAAAQFCLHCVLYSHLFCGVGVVQNVLHKFIRVVHVWLTVAGNNFPQPEVVFYSGYVEKVLCNSVERYFFLLCSSSRSV